MQKTTIENKGITKTVINTNGDKNENEIRWKADYDGEKADIKVDISKNCKKDKVRIQLNNSDLANILGIKPVPLPIHKRLENDFLDSDSEQESEPVPESKTELEEDLKRLLNLTTLNPKTLPEIKDKYKPEPYLFRVNIPNPKYSSLSESESESGGLESITDDSDLKSTFKLSPIKVNSTPEVLSVSEMLFDPEFNLTAPPLILRKPPREAEAEAEAAEEFKPILNSISDSFILPEYNTFKQTTPLRRRLRSRNKRLQNANANFFNKNKSKKFVKNGKIGKPFKSAKIGKSTKLGKKKSVKFLYKTPSPKTYRVHLTSK